VGWETNCGENPTRLYPPVAFLLAPGEEFDGTSGVPVVDGALAAFAEYDPNALVATVEWQLVECLELGVSLGIGQPPYCEGDEQPGDLIETIGISSCEGVPERRATALESFTELSHLDWTVFAIVDEGPSRVDHRTRYAVIMAHAPSETLGAISLTFSKAGLTSVWFGCGPIQPQ
jgi:hypothetical protein